MLSGAGKIVLLLSSLLELSPRAAAERTESRLVRPHTARGDNSAFYLQTMSLLPVLLSRKYLTSNGEHSTIILTGLLHF